jgi:hypothetical protein
MELQKRTRYSKRLSAEEIEEIMMEDESDEVLEELNEFIEPYENVSSSSSGNEAEDVEISFRVRRLRDSPKVLDFTGPPSGINRSAALNINVKSVTVCVLWTVSRSSVSECKR